MAMAQAPALHRQSTAELASYIAALPAGVVPHEILAMFEPGAEDAEANDVRQVRERAQASAALSPVVGAVDAAEPLSAKTLKRPAEDEPGAAAATRHGVAQARHPPGRPWHSEIDALAGSDDGGPGTG